MPETVIASAWDSALDSASAVYRRRMYNFFADNCHCYVACFLNNVRTPFACATACKYAMGA